jgi:hypothetical protein
MIIFAFVLLVPFSIVSYNISKNNTISNIEFSNNVIFSQMNSNYRNNSDLMAKICLEVFLSGSVQQFLYSHEIDYFDVSVYIRNLAGTTATVNSSIDSIVLYNSRRGEWFSTLNTDPPRRPGLNGLYRRTEFYPKAKTYTKANNKAAGKRHHKSLGIFLVYVSVFRPF